MSFHRSDNPVRFDQNQHRAESALLRTKIAHKAFSVNPIIGKEIEERRITQFERKQWEDPIQASLDAAEDLWIALTIYVEGIFRECRMQ